MLVCLFVQAQQQIRMLVVDPSVYALAMLRVVEMCSYAVVQHKLLARRVLPREALLRFAAVTALPVTAARFQLRLLMLLLGSLELWRFQQDLPTLASAEASP